MASHAGHNHPATPAARATCRKLGLDAKVRIESDGSTSSKVIQSMRTGKMVPVPSPVKSDRCTIRTTHCEQCGSTSPEDLLTDDGYTSCCNELITDQAACRNHHAH